MSNLIEPKGEIVARTDLKLPRARSFADVLAGGANVYARLVECRAGDGGESVVFEAEVELGQLRVHPIRPRERLVALFPPDDATTPEVLSLRDDFPSVPHRSLRYDEFPRSLCLYDEPFRDLKKTWTAARFLERVRDWLALTAKGRLHHEDQPLEPLFVAQDHVILPDDLFDGERDFSQRLRIEPIEYPNGNFVCLLSKAPPVLTATEPPKPGEKPAGFDYVATAFRCAAQTHGVIRRQPATLRDLAEVFRSLGRDFLSELKERLAAWQREKAPLAARLILVIWFPKTRDEEGRIEATDVWTFLTSGSLLEVGAAIGLWDVHDGKPGTILGGDASRDGRGIKLALLHSHFNLSRSRAARLEGRTERFDGKIAAVGVGALGSQVTLNLARSAFGEWTIIDDDLLLPHNLARHALDGNALGYPKAYALATFANSLIEGDSIVRAILADVLDPGKSQQAVGEAFAAADIILDLSASVAVARHLAHAPDLKARRISIFLNPTGEDLVVLAEDAGRSSPLDSLEMQYYRALVTDERLDGHFRPLDGRARYGQSCRDVTSRIPQDSVALHAANASRIVKTISSTSASRIIIWRSDRDGNVRRVDIGTAPVIRHAIGDWTVCLDALLVHRLAQLRDAKLPRETGGVLIGSFDLERRIAYIVETIPSPPDSEEWPTLYIRGCRGLRGEVDRLAERTDGMLEYIGEWHSHPAGCSTAPSADDVRVFGWLTESMDVEGLPALMMIVGDDGHSSCYIGLMARNECLLPEMPR